MQHRGLIIGGCLLLGLVVVARLDSTFKTPQTSHVRAQATECDATDTTNWCQAGRTPQRTAYYPQTLGATITNNWEYGFSPDKLYPQIQAIVYKASDNVVRTYVGTEGGYVYAFRVSDGNLTLPNGWSKKVGGPIVSSLAVISQTVYAASVDGYVYALQATTGNLIWSKQVSPDTGLSASPLLAEGKLVVAGRNGHVYALDLANSGNILWDFDAGAPILQTPAYDNGKVFVGTMAMYVYAVNLSGGTQAWKSAKINAVGMNDWWPIVTQGKVIIRPYAKGRCPSTPGATTCTSLKTLFVLDTADGHELLPVSPAPGANFFTQSDVPMQHGSMPPPCVAADGHLVIPYAATYFNDYSGTSNYWGELDLASGAMIDKYIATSQNNETGVKNLDEQVIATCAQNVTVIMHISESTKTPGNTDEGVALSGTFDLSNRTWKSINPQFTTRLGLATAWQNTQSAGGNQVSIAGGKMIHLNLNSLNVRTFQ